jgi:hypothetical protein
MVPLIRIVALHEALICHWPRLVEWLNRDRALQSWLAQIRPNIGAWSRDRSDEAPLLRGGMLVQGAEWFAKRRDDLNQEEQAYIETSSTGAIGDPPMAGCPSAGDVGF